jgi:uncharacterized protein
VLEASEVSDPSRQSADSEPKANANKESSSAKPASNKKVVKTSARAWLRSWLRALHRDAGYLAVGLTVIYAVSGLAVNHIADYTDGDASFRKFNRTYELGALASKASLDDRALAAEIVAAAKRAGGSSIGNIKDVYRVSDSEIELTLEESSMRVDLKTGRAEHEGKQARFFLRFANWLHLNRGKKGWTYIADAYAVALLFLAISGLFMIPGKKGLWGRGIVLALVGAALPVIYIQFLAK